MLKSSKWRPIALAVLIILLLAAAVFLFFLMKLNVLPTDYLLLIAAIVVLFVYVAGVLLFFGMRRKRSPGRRVRRIIGIVLLVIYIALSIAMGFLIFRRGKRADRGYISVDSSDAGRVISSPVSLEV